MGKERQNKVSKPVKKVASKAIAKKSAAVKTKAKVTSKPKSIGTLMYFAIHGKAEPIRMLLQQAKQTYHDIQLERDVFA